MTKIFAQVKSKNDNEYYSTYIDIDEKGEVVDYGCTCVYGSFYMWSVKNGGGDKPCWHINHLKEKYEKARRLKNERKKEAKLDTASDNDSVPAGSN